MGRRAPACHRESEIITERDCLDRTDTAHHLLPLLPRGRSRQCCGGLPSYTQKHRVRRWSHSPSEEPAVEAAASGHATESPDVEERGHGGPILLGAHFRSPERPGQEGELVLVEGDRGPAHCDTPEEQLATQPGQALFVDSNFTGNEAIQAGVVYSINS